MEVGISMYLTPWGEKIKCGNFNKYIRGVAMIFQNFIFQSRNVFVASFTIEKWAIQWKQLKKSKPFCYWKKSCKFLLNPALYKALPLSECNNKDITAKKMVGTYWVSHRVLEFHNDTIQVFQKFIRPWFHKCQINLMPHKVPFSSYMFIQISISSKRSFQW